MATVTANDLEVIRPLGGVPFGNFTMLPFSMTLAAGKFVDSDTPSTAIGITDKVILGTIPAGTKLVDMITYTDGAHTDTSTMTLGFEYVDGVDDGDVPQDADYFCASVVLTTAAITRKTNVAAPVTIPKDAYLIYTNGVAAQAAAGVIDISLLGICDQG